MLKKLFLWFFGYLEVRLRGYSPERFMNLCNNKHIYLWNIEHKDGIYCFCILRKDFLKLRHIARKSKTMPIITKRYGLPFLWKRYKKRQGFFLGFLCCVLLIYILSLFIWNISVEGGYKYTETTLLQYLKTINIYSGMQKKMVDGKYIEEQIRITYPDIGWVSAEVRGTRLIIKIEETSMPKAAKETREASNIVASKDGIVVQMVTRTGTPMVKVGDVVRKGDILVSGVVKVIGDNETIVNHHAVVADADIVIKTFYNYTDKLNLGYKEKKYTNNKKKGFILKLFGKKIISYNPRYSYRYYDIIKNNMSVHITDSYYLPIEYIPFEVKEYYETNRVYTKEEAEEIVEHELMRYLNYLSSHGVELLRNEVLIQSNDKICEAKGKIIVNEPAWEYKKIDDSEWRLEDVNESDGNNS